MIEVWNKIDNLDENIRYELIKKDDFDVVPISALYNINIQKLLNQIDTKIN